ARFICPSFFGPDSNSFWRKYSVAGQNDTAVELLAGDDYQLAERLLDYGINHTGVSSDIMRRTMIVNYANAVKLGGDSARAEKELGKHDWSATNAAFQICVAAVRDDVKSVVDQMQAAVRGQELGEEQFRTWPVFKKARSEKLFQDQFKKLFGRDLISAVSLDSKSETLVISNTKRESLEDSRRNLEETKMDSKLSKGKTRH
ncbi:hypothetical protein AAFX91_41420, partial [Bradyrhizobium sp. 31Argb]|uniref:hypothetical protein n=1 Tax=Bradyrhizobium sp. 31Argb TaxID=3141247 RepID=UPI0037498A63